MWETWVIPPFAFAAEMLASPVATNPRMVWAPALPYFVAFVLVVAMYPYFVSLTSMPINGEATG